LNNNEYIKDDLIRNLTVFSSDSLINHEYSLFKEGHLLQIDKSSCIAPYALNPPENSYIIDCCSAPGNKTIILANLIKNNGFVIVLLKFTVLMNSVFLKV
jgi:16S rRNA C967 or C1407 C5-methylase (RsmB/RsmF family)